MEDDKESTQLLCGKYQSANKICLKASQDFSRFHVCNCMRRSTLSLQQLALKCISANQLRYINTKTKPFSHIPWSILTMLINQFKEDENLNNPTVFACILTSQTRIIDLDFPIKLRKERIWTEEDISLIFELIVERCSVSLQVLNVRLAGQSVNLMAGTIPFNLHTQLIQLSNLLSHLCRLHQLTLRDCSIDDDTLKIIGLTCDELRELRIEWNPNVTDKGIDVLCATPGSRCKLLKTLKLTGTSVTSLGLLKAMYSLHYLEILEHPELDSAVEMLFTVTHPQRATLKLKSLCISSNSDTSLLSNVMPFIEMLCIDKTPSIYPLMTLKNISKLALYNSDISENDFSYLIINFSNRLTNLEIICCNFETDMSLIGFYCIKLEYFKINSKVKRDMQFNLNYFKHFLKLQFVEISGNSMLYNLQVTFGVLLASQFLKNVIFDSLTLRDGMFDNLIDRAQLDSNVFANLESITFRSCKQVHLIALSILKIIPFAPQLKEIIGLQFFSLT